jgi:hypothetical protein
MMEYFHVVFIKVLAQEIQIIPNWHLGEEHDSKLTSFYCLGDYPVCG